MVDDHIHVVLYCDAKQKGTLSRTLSLAIRPRCAVPLASPFIRPVTERGHIQWLADNYILRQPWKHGLAVHPAVWTGSCFPDLVGARLLPGLALNLPVALPRWRLHRAFEAVFLPGPLLEPANDSRLRAIGSANLAAACANAVGADPTLASNGPPEVLARRAAAVLAKAVHLPNSEIAHALRMHPVASARLQERSVEESVLVAARVWVTLEATAAAAPAPPLPPATVRERATPVYRAHPV